MAAVVLSYGWLVLLDLQVCGIRWFLARLNGRGLGRAGLFKWVPFGTLAANVSASCIMAALSTVGKFDLGNFPNHVKINMSP